MNFLKNWIIWGAISFVVALIILAVFGPMLLDSPLGPSDSMFTNGSVNADGIRSCFFLSLIIGFLSAIHSATKGE